MSFTNVLKLNQTMKIYHERLNPNFFFFFPLCLGTDESDPAEFSAPFLAGLGIGLNAAEMIEDTTGAVPCSNLLF